MSVKTMFAGFALGTALMAGPAMAVEGPFTQAQVDAGKVTYNNKCRECHAKDGAGALGPALHGDQFKQMFGGQPIANMRDWIHDNMPQNAPGSLADADLNVLVSLILSWNGYTPGSAELSADSVKTVQFDPK